MFILSFISSDLEFWSVNHTSTYENSELRVFLFLFLFDLRIFLLEDCQSLFHVFDDILKISWISDTQYHPSCNSKFLFHVGADNLNLLFLYDLFIFFHICLMLRFDKAKYLLLLFMSIVSKRLSDRLWGADLLNFIELIILLYTVLLISFTRYEE